MSSGGIARTPKPPYYAVIFTSVRTPGDQGYAETSDRMVELSSQQPGFLGMESVRAVDGTGITVCYWESADAIAAWKAQAEHLVAQRRGRQDWYEHYEVRVARVERVSNFDRNNQ
jgi:heme-degrading monooxygenase HmoA